MVNSINENNIYYGAEDSFRISNKRFNILHGKDEARSTSKLKPIHGKIAREFRKVLPSAFTIHSYGFPNNKGKEINFLLPYCNGSKNVDIGISYKYKSIGAILFRQCYCNLSQNEGNYYNSFAGDTSALRRAGYAVGQLSLFASNPKYYKRDGSVKKIELFAFKNLSSYNELFNRDPISDFERPDNMCVSIVDIDYDNYNTFTPALPGNIGCQSNKEQNDYNKLSNITRFLTEFSQTCQLKIQ